MSDRDVDWQAPREPVRNPDDFPGYPSSEVREGIRQWGSIEDWQRWREWEEFIRGETDEEPASLADWLPDHELVRLEREREAEEAELRRKEKLVSRAQEVMREQISALEDAIASRYIRSPLVFAFKGYPGPGERRPPSGNGWKQKTWIRRYGSYARKWNRFMTGETDQPPRRNSDVEHLAGLEVNIENTERERVHVTEEINYRAAIKDFLGRPIPPDGELRVWLDDDPVDRRAPEGWVHVRSAREACFLLLSGRVVELSLDNDLNNACVQVGDSDEEIEKKTRLADENLFGSGFQVLDFLEEQYFSCDNSLWPEAGIAFHTANPDAKRRMIQTVERVAERGNLKLEVVRPPDGRRERYVLSTL